MPRQGCDREENVSVHLLKRAEREMSSGRISENVPGKESDQKLVDSPLQIVLTEREVDVSKFVTIER